MHRVIFRSSHPTVGHRSMNIFPEGIFHEHSSMSLNRTVARGTFRDNRGWEPVFGMINMCAMDVRCVIAPEDSSKSPAEFFAHSECRKLPGNLSNTMQRLPFVEQSENASNAMYRISSDGQRISLGAIPDVTSNEMQRPAFEERGGEASNVEL